MKRRREIEETAQYLGTLEGEDGLRGAMSAPQDISIETTALLSLHRQLAREVSPDLSEEGRERVLGTLMTAIAQQPQERTPSMLERIIATVVTKATAVSVAGLLLAGSAMSASAAFGGPNLPAQALTAVGLSANSHQAAPATLGINNAPDAAANGKSHANTHAFDGSGNAASASPTSSAAASAATPISATQGINNAPDAAANGKSHANAHAFNGSGNAVTPSPTSSAAASAATPISATQGINNAPDAAANGKSHANEHAFNGSGNATTALETAVAPNTTSATPTPPTANATDGASNASEGIGNAPSAAQPGAAHANPDASTSSGNAPIAIPTPPSGSGLGGHATTQGH